MEKEKAVLYPKRGGVASVRQLHDIVEHDGAIEEVLEEECAAITLNKVLKNGIK